MSESRSKSKLGANLDRNIPGEGSLSIIIRERSKNLLNKEQDRFP